MFNNSLLSRVIFGDDIVAGSKKLVRNLHFFGFPSELSRKQTINRYNYRANLRPGPLNRAELESFGSLRTGYPFPNYSDGGGASHLVAGASRRPINLLRSSKPGACSQAMKMVVRGRPKGDDRGREFNDFESFRRWFLGRTTLPKVLAVIYKAIWDTWDEFRSKNVGK